MTLPSLIWGSPQWMAVTLGLVGLAAGVLLWSYTRAEAKRSVRITAGVLKALGFTALAISLLEPLLTGSRPRRGANAWPAAGRISLENAPGPGLRRSQLCF
jgi:hypothetical protein